MADADPIAAMDARADSLRTLVMGARYVRGRLASVTASDWRVILASIEAERDAPARPGDTTLVDITGIDAIERALIERLKAEGWTAPTAAAPTPDPAPRRRFDAPFDDPDWHEELRAIRERAASDDPGSDRANLLRALDAETQDTMMLARNLAVIYDDISGGTVSKPNTDAEVVIRLYNERLSKEVNEAVAEAEAASGSDALREALPDGWALTITYHPAPENRWIASAWNFNGGVSKGIVDGFGRTEDEAKDALRAALTEPGATEGEP